MKAFIKLIANQREWLLLPLFCGGVLLAMKLYFLLTGRAPVDDPGEIVGACYVAVKLSIAVALTGYVQDHHFGYRSRGENPRLRDDIYDSCVTFGLLSLFVWALWH